MNIFNRIIVTLLAVVVVVGAALISLITLGIVTPQQIIPGAVTTTPIGQGLASFAQLQPNATLVTILSSSLAFLLGLVLLVFELRPAPKEDIIRLRGDGLGSVTVHIDSVRKLILHSVALIPEVLQVQPQIRWSPQGLNIYCRTALLSAA